MPVTSFGSGTQTSVIDTEHTLSQVNAAAVYVCEVNTVNMVAGDVLELRAYRTILLGGTTSLEQLWTIIPPNDVKVIRFHPISNDHADVDAIKYTLKQTAGSPRNYDWKVLKHA